MYYTVHRSSVRNAKKKSHAAERDRLLNATCTLCIQRDIEEKCFHDVHSHTCSTAISSKGFIECFTPAVSTPRLSARTRICVERSVASWTKAEWFYQASVDANYKYSLSVTGKDL